MATPFLDIGPGIPRRGQPNRVADASAAERKVVQSNEWNTNERARNSPTRDGIAATANRRRIVRLIIIL